MTRIVSGFAGSLSLAVPPAGTRPTSDKVREALFSGLEARDVLDGARVLDLYAGSGALALEAVSRGAASAVLVERNAAAARICQRNVATVLGAASAAERPTVRVVQRGVAEALRADAGEYDLVFLDPPYGLADEELAEALRLTAPRLADGAVVIVERATRSSEPEWPVGIHPDRERTYGETTLWWAGA